MNKIKIFFITFILLFLIGMFAIIANKDNTSENLSPIKIVYISDNNYVNYLRTSIKSIVANKKKNSKVEIYVIGVNLSKKNSKKILRESKNNVHISLIKTSGKDLKFLKGRSSLNRHVTGADNAKFFISSFLKNVDKVLYLDSDTIILKDLSELYNTNLDDNYVGAVDDWQTGWYENKSKRYFNNGVMLLNLKKILEDDIETKLIDFKLNDKINRFVTQDAFNNIMYDKVVFLPLIYNTFGPEYDNKNILERIKQTLNKNYNPKLYQYRRNSDFKKDIVIIHYCGYNYKKPWIQLNLKKSSYRIWYQYAPLDFWIDYFKQKSLFKIAKGNKNA